MTQEDLFSIIFMNTHGGDFAIEYSFGMYPQLIQPIDIIYDGSVVFKLQGLTTDEYYNLFDEAKYILYRDEQIALRVEAIDKMVTECESIKEKWESFKKWRGISLAFPKKK